VLNQIQEQILSEENVRRYIELSPAGSQSQLNPSAEEQALKLTITDVETRIRRWEDTLERGLFVA